MPLAVTHVLTSIFLVGLYRDFVTKHKKYFTLYTLVIAGLAGLLPDIDIPINWILSFFGYSFDLLLHGGITHTPLFGLIFLIPGFIFWKMDKHRIAGYFFVICFGILLHITLDYIIGGGAYEGVMWFFPFSFETYKLHLLTRWGFGNLTAALDAVILLAWVFYIEKKHKILDFI